MCYRGHWAQLCATLAGTVTSLLYEVRGRFHDEARTVCRNQDRVSNDAFARLYAQLVPPVAKGPRATCYIQAPCSRATRPPSSRTYHASQQSSPLTRSSSRSPPTPRPHRSLPSSLRSPLSRPPAASGASRRRWTSLPPPPPPPPPRMHPSRARWRSSARSRPCCSAAIFLGGRRRRWGGGMRCGGGTNGRRAATVARSTGWRGRKTWTGRRYGVVD